MHIRLRLSLYDCNYIGKVFESFFYRRSTYSCRPLMRGPILRCSNLDTLVRTPLKLFQYLLDSLVLQRNLELPPIISLYNLCKLKIHNPDLTSIFGNQNILSPDITMNNVKRMN